MCSSHFYYFHRVKTEQEPFVRHNQDLFLSLRISSEGFGLTEEPWSEWSDRVILSLRFRTGNDRGGRQELQDPTRGHRRRGRVWSEEPSGSFPSNSEGRGKVGVSGQRRDVLRYPTETPVRPTCRRLGLSAVSVVEVTDPGSRENKNPW